MKLPRILLIAVQVLMANVVMALCAWSGVAWVGTFSIGALIAIAIAASISRAENRSARAIELILSWVCTTTATVVLVGGNTFWDNSSGCVASAVGSITAASLIPAMLASGQSVRRTSWKMQIMFWCAFGAPFLIYDSLFLTSPWPFYGALGLTCLLVIGCKISFRPPHAVILMENTVLLVLIGLPIADNFVRPPLHTTINDHTDAPYYYRASTEHPGIVYKCWLPLILPEWERMRKAIAVANPDGKAPRYRFKPGAKFRYYHCDVRINNLGFRGRDIAVSKGNALRIVAIGESTTFGFTLNPEDRPWPDLLEEMIRTRLTPGRPVEVINAGFPALTIEDSLARFEQDILPLKPDMIICYHGINGFHFLDGAIPPAADPAPPVYAERPLKLIANLEYRWNVRKFYKRRLAYLQSHPPTFGDVLHSKYAADLRRLINLCNTNGISLVIGTFSLAVNSSSEREVIHFYQDIYPDVPWTIRANEAYTTMLRGLAREDPTIHLVDTHPGLDGNFSQFTDVMHLNQQGREKVAEAFFAGVKEVLATKTSPLN